MRFGDYAEISGLPGRANTVNWAGQTQGRGHTDASGVAVAECAIVKTVRQFLEKTTG